MKDRLTAYLDRTGKVIIRATEDGYVVIITDKSKTFQPPKTTT